MQGLNLSLPIGVVPQSLIPTNGINPLNANQSSIIAVFTSLVAGNSRVDLWSTVWGVSSAPTCPAKTTSA